MQYQFYKISTDVSLPRLPDSAWPYHLFERQDPPETTPTSLDKADERLERGKVVRCAYCKSMITYQGNAEQIRGQHIHSFINPGGYEFTIACYCRAWCEVMGLPTLRWSWFNGCTWQYAMCPQCQEHLGWFYLCASDDSSFYGLILERIIIERADGEEH